MVQEQLYGLCLCPAPAMLQVQLAMRHCILGKITLVKTWPVEQHPGRATTGVDHTKLQNQHT